jgi:glycosyltransferase involved in cell wall biosynthesis
VLISYVVPAFNASTTIARTLASVFDTTLPKGWSVEVLVIDDGSSDSAALATLVGNHLNARLLLHASNRGTCAGRNTGIAASRGDIVVMLDADDELVPGWPEVVNAATNEWPPNTKVCFLACCNPQGKVTAQNPSYNGVLTLNDMLNERHSGEYIPLFRGDYVRQKKYIDLGMPKPCEVVSYINFAHDAPFWISSRILRIYNEGDTSSLTYDWTNPKKACEAVQCYRELFNRYGLLYQRDAPKIWNTKRLRLAVYLRLAAMPGAWNWWLAGASFSCMKESVGALIILILGPKLGAKIAKFVKKVGLIRQYG